MTAAWHAAAVNRVAAPATPDHLCSWVHRYSGQVVRCGESAIPGEVVCADHLIEKTRTQR